MKTEEIDMQIELIIKDTLLEFQVQDLTADALMRIACHKLVNSLEYHYYFGEKV